ncbi:DUF58 domain-containing protein [Alteromonas sp. C1M14]|uniref:DUF58 domain-containing protein n=1 Tax=Alteromonas sp. C1M14 TaxID=2841567 RepID=UPI001C0874B8|nr:DUF58 domain-containing protein [Alteromonas sp. C1M14]MBU2978890.1 DUF58 domain-containing protein [Alteromonas sp. C1M14]
MVKNVAIRALAERWLKKRISPQQTLTLNRKNIFIFPGLFGLFYIAMTMCLFILAINYQNNLLLFMSQFLASLLLITLFTTYKNFSGLHFHAKAVKPVFMGEDVVLQIKIATQKQHCGHLEARWRHQRQKHLIDLESDDTTIRLPVSTTQRGEFTLPRVTFSLAYPLGLIRCWTHIDFDQNYLVYPQKQPCALLLSSAPVEEGEQQTIASGNDDFYAIQPWQKTDPLHRVAWKRVAKGGDWTTKVFSTPQAQTGYLDIAEHGADVELALKRLSWQVDTLARQGATYGLRLHQLTIAPANTDAHRKACLRALAVFAKSTTL